MILVADQNRTTAELLVRRLRADGFAADSASTSSSVLRRVEAGGVAAVVLDPGLPGSPYEALARIRGRATTRALPVLVFGTSDRPQDNQAAIAAGATAFLVKGRVTPTELVARIRSLLSSGTAPDAVKGNTSTEQGAYYLWVKPEGDAQRLAGDLGAAAGLRCTTCGDALALYVQRDFSRWGRWLFGTFGCLACARTSETPAVVPVAEDPLGGTAGAPIEAHGGTR